jgi:hypothetical protein
MRVITVMKSDFRKKLGATLAAATIVLVASLLIFCLIFLIACKSYGFVNFLLIIYIAIELTVIVGVLIALKQRFKEIDDGEEKEAKKY